MTGADRKAAVTPGARYRLEVLLLFVLLVTLALIASRYAWLERLDHLGYDALISQVAPPLDERLVIVAIDQQSLTAGGRWPWPRARQAELLTKILAQKPAAVLLDVVFDTRSEPADDAALAEALATAAPSVVALPVILEAVARFRPAVELLPYPELLAQTDVLGHVHVELDSDSISRGTYLYQGIGEPHWPHLSLALAEQLGEAPQDLPSCAPSLGFSLANQRCLYRMLPFAGPPGTVPAVSAAELLDGSVAPSLLSGKVVFVGLVAAGVADWVTSPVSGEGRPISGVEYNANLYNALAADRLIAPARPLWSVLVCALIAALAAVALPRLPPKGMLALTLLLAALPILLAAGALAFADLYLPLSAALLAVLAAYPYWSWRRHEIAWGYVDQEMARLATIRSAYPLRADPVDVDWPAEGARLASLLALECQALPAPTEIQGLKIRPEERQIEVLLGAAGSLRLGPASAADATPMSDAELALTEGVFADLTDEVLSLPEVPGEGLATRLRSLRQQTRQLERDRTVSAQALEEMSSAVAVLSPLAQVELANGRWLELTGLAPGSFALDRDRSRNDAHPGLDELLPLPVGRTWGDLWRQVAVAREAADFESRLPAGPLLYVSCAPLQVAPAGSWAITLSDVSEITEARDRREEALAFLSHDLRSPIVSVLALVQQPPTGERDQRIAQYARRSLTVSEQFLQLSRLESQPRVELYPLELLAVLDNAIDQVFESARVARVQVAAPGWQGEPEEHLFALGNGELLERAFANLLGNAVKYSDAGQRVRIELQRLDDRVEIAIVDEGLGIPEEDLPHLFDAYFRASEPGLAQRRGSGLGLRFARTVADRHGGTLTVRSQFGVGSTFVFTLPVDDQLAYNED
jgi:CHASE2 domain-containing sensor protein